MLVESSNHHGRSILEGIVQYSQEHGPWCFHLCELSRDANPPPWVETWKGDGIIARIENRRVAKAVAATGLPAVAATGLPAIGTKGRPAANLGAARFITSIPLVETHDRAVAKLAVDHLVERGLRHFAFCGDSRYTWSKYRQAYFEELVRAAGFECHSFNPEPSHHLGKEYDAIAQWLSKLPRPSGIMACYDSRAHHILDVCRDEGIVVPDEIAVIGVDNDDLLCRLTSPPLTSVVLNSKGMGYLAAGLLDRMMAGETVAPEIHLMEPVGIVCRQSTDVLAIKDPLVARAVRFIYEHACEGINVNDVLREVPTSRRALESRFKKFLERSPHDEIIKVRIRRVKELLYETDLPLYVIAEKTGFEHVEYLSVAFNREEGLWPSAFRAQRQSATLQAGKAGNIRP